ncbi:MAG: IS66 family transposase [Nanoarchaeota archaeon]|nr:IS66 family transposase [Nanoarchaeota archaeon]
MNLEKRVKELEIKLSKALQRIEELEYFERENKLLKKRIEELEGIVKEKTKPPFVKEDVKEEPKKTGQKEGHVGYSRHVPERIDEIKEHKLDKCPICGEPVSDTQEIRERIIEDIEQPRIKNTKHIIHRCYCKKCDKIVEPEINDALPNARFGLRLMLLVLILKLDSRVTSNKIVSILDTIFGIKISDGEIFGILKQLSEAFGDYYETLVKKIQEAVTKHIDETGWRINGKNYWLWIFINKEIALYVVEKQRSSDVPKKVLGNQEGKFITTDRLSAYNVLVEDTGCLQQVCWTHLLRNSKDLAKHYPEAKYIHKRMKFIFKKAKGGKTPKEKLLNWIDLIAGRRYHGTEVPKFVRSVCRTHREDLFRFIDNPEINPSNNLAEQGLRPAVVIRKVSGGSRSENGAEITGKLLSVLQTAKLQSSNSFNFLSDLLQLPK